MKRNLLFIVAILLSAFSVSRTYAQEAGASLRGTVTDQSGAVIIGANVTATNTLTNVSLTTQTDSTGTYLFPILPAGTYTAKVEKDGFVTFEQKGIVLELNQHGLLNVSLKIGQATQTVEVTGNVAQVDTTGAVLGKVEDQRAINALPLVNRDTLQLGLLQAGVTAADPGDGSGNPFSVSGQRSESMTFLVNGSDNTDYLSNNIVVSPNPDAVQEFRILTNNYDAEYGRTSGGIVNQITKSGGNKFHGDVFEFLRNDALNANDFLLNAEGVGRSPFKRNVFGGTLGGPIKHDKLFFFAAYQGARRREGETSPPLTVLDPAERTGNFAELCPAGFDAGGNCTDTTTGTQLVNPVTGNNYANNQVPVEPVIANYIAKFLPLPLPGLANNTFISSPSAATDEDQGVLRVDDILTSRDTISFNYLIDNTRQVFPFFVNNGASTGGDVPNGSGFSNKIQDQVGSISWNHSFDSGWTNELRGNINRTSTHQAVPSDTTSPSALGFANVSPDDAAGAAPPIIFTPDFNLGPSPQGPTKLNDVVFGFDDNFALPHGRHEFRFGASVARVRDNFQFDFFNNGSLDFAGFGVGPINGTFTGNSLADFVGGFPDNFFQFSAATYAIRATQSYFYGQDTWKVVPRLTLTLGLRYEYYQPPYDIHNELFGPFPGQQSTKFPNAPPTLLYPGDPGTPNRALVYPDWNNFAPRFGFAWDMLGNAKLIMRGGFGVFYDIEDGALNLQYGGQAPFGAVENINFFTFSGNNVDAVSDPFTAAGLPNIPGTSGNNPYPFAARGLTGTFLTPKVGFAFTTAPHFRTPYTEDFNYGFQYQLTPNTMLEAVYVGSLGRKLISTTDVNLPSQAIEAQQLSVDGFINPDCARPLGACTLDGNQPSSTDPVTTDANGILTGAGELLTDVSAGLSDSHQLQVTLDKRWSHGFLSRAAYTFGKTIDITSGFRERSSTFTDPLDPRVDRGLADFDARHRFVLSGIWEVPTGTRIKDMKLVNRILGGWQLGSIVTYQSGNPIPINSGNDSLGFGLGADRPDVTGPIKKFNPRTNQTITADCLFGSATGNFYFDPTNLNCNSVPQFTVGTLGRNVVIGPGINNYDISFDKKFAITESQSLEFRSEFFNAFNHAQFADVGRNGDSGNFGQVTSTRGPRLIQFGLKYYF